MNKDCKQKNNADIVIKPIVQAYCKENNLEFSPAAYANFLRSLQKFATACVEKRGQLEYWPGEIADLKRELSFWATLYYVEESSSDIPGYCSLRDTVHRWCVEPKVICQWMRRNENQIKLFGGRYYIALESVEQIQNDWENVRLARDLTVDYLADYPASTRPILKHVIMDALEEDPPACLIPCGSFPQERKGSRYLFLRDLQEYERWMSEVSMDIPAFPYTYLEKITHMDRDRVRKLIKAKTIHSISPKRGEILITLREIGRIKSLALQYITVDSIVDKLALSCVSKFNLENQKDRDQLIVFASQHSWWDLDVQMDSELPLLGGKLHFLVAKADSDILSQCLRLWFLCYRRAYADQIRIILGDYKENLPYTTKLLYSYIFELPDIGQAHVDMVDALLDILPCDLIELDTERRIAILDMIAPYTTIAARKELAKFYKCKGLVNGEIKIAPSGKKQDTSAYPIWDFATMVFAMIGEEEVERLGLVLKAVSNKEYADLWLFTVLHLFASWRSTDLIKLSPPRLPYAADVVLEKIRNNTYSMEDAREVANRFIAWEENLWRYPNKTKEYSGINRLYIYCPENCIDIFGLILSIAGAHYELDLEAESFVRKVCSIKTIFRFYGSEFVEACGYRDFSGRKANKTLMQAIEWEANEQGKMCPLVAYSMAALMRSHKRSYGDIAHMTADYVGDGTYSGYTKEFIFLQQMLRGSCSFHIDHMLRTLYREQYTELPLVLRTEAIQSIGIPNKYIDRMLLYVQKAMISAEQTLEEVFSSPEEMEKALFQIACGKGHGKDMHTQCLCKAADMSCKYPERLSCLGCKFEIKSQAIITKLSGVCDRLLDEVNQDGIVGQRAQWLLENRVYPAMAEIYVHVERSPEGESSFLMSLFPRRILQDNNVEDQNESEFNQND